MAEFTVPDGIRPADLDRFLEALIGNGNMDQALLRQTSGDALELRRFARQAGYPSRQPMRDARAALRELYPEITASTAPAARTATVPSPTAQEAKTAHPSFQVFEKPATAATVALTLADDDKSAQDPVPHAAILKESVAAVARAANDSGSKSIAAAGERLVRAHDTLVQALRTHAEDAAKAARIAALQAELARLRGKSTTSSAAAGPKQDSPAKLVRAWAAEQGIACPTHGRVPQRVQDAYDAAHAEVAHA